MRGKPLALYVHIPFCIRKCAYCDFLSAPGSEETRESYVNLLCQEIEKEAVCCPDHRGETVFFGGGTPTVLRPEQLERILCKLKECFPAGMPGSQMEPEITLECNPGTVNGEDLQRLRAAGFNRLSIGLQSMDNGELKKLGRIHTREEFLETFRLAREAGFGNINVDLMSALPGQSVESYVNSLEEAAGLHPEHISAYSLIIEEGTPFYERYGGEGGIPLTEEEKQKLRSSHQSRSILPGDYGNNHMELPPLPDEDTDRKMYEMTRELLAAQGYERYEISNYSRSGFACRHNIGYWTGVDYLGLGLGASSYISGYRYHNETSLKKYLSLDLQKAGAAACDIQELSLEDKMEEFMFLGLRMMKGVSGNEFLGRFGRNMWKLYGQAFDKLQAQGLIEIEAPWVRLSRRGIDVSNRVFQEFLL